MNIYEALTTCFAFLVIGFCIGWIVARDGWPGDKH